MTVSTTCPGHCNLIWLHGGHGGVMWQQERPVKQMIKVCALQMPSIHISKMAAPRIVFLKSGPNLFRAKPATTFLG